MHVQIYTDDFSSDTADGAGVAGETRRRRRWWQMCYVKIYEYINIYAACIAWKKGLSAYRVMSPLTNRRWWARAYGTTAGVIAAARRVYENIVLMQTSTPRDWVKIKSKK